MTGVFPIIIIGGGPAGLMAAEVIARETGGAYPVIVCERKQTPARKFLMAGRGGLNLTHSEEMPRFLARYGEAAPQIKPMLDAFTPQDLRQWCEGLGQETFVGSSGRVFPRAMKASPLLRAWRQRLADLGVELRVNCDWQGWGDDGQLLFATPDGAWQVMPAATLLALGGASWAKLGSDGGWAGLLQARGVGIAPFAPANSGFLCPWSQAFGEKFAGQPLKPVALSFGGRRVQGEAMITRSGIEGGAVYALSALLRDAVMQSGEALLSVDVKPDTDAASLAAKLSRPRQAQSFANFLRREINLSPLALGLLYETGGETDVRALSPKDLALRLKALPLRLTGLPPIDRASATAGGVRFAAVTDDLMLRRLPGVFVAGEMLDWEAPTGGYLLQGTFASAVRAAKGMLKHLQ